MLYNHIPRIVNTVLSGPDRIIPRSRLWAKPLRIEVDVNNYCNLRCPHCLRESPSTPKNCDRLSAADLARVAPWFSAAHIVRLGGTGEPFIQKDLFDIIGLVHRHGATVSLITNCTLIDEDAARRLCGPGLMLLHMSIDAGTPEVFERVRLGAKFSEVVANIDRLAAIKKETRSVFPLLNINMTLMRETLGEIEAVIALAKRWGVVEIIAQTVTFFGRPADLDQTITNREALDALARAEPAAREAGVRLRYVPLASDFESLAQDEAHGARIESGNLYHDHLKTSGSANRFYCPYIWHHMWIDVQGNVAPCCMADFGRVGNIRDKDPEELWNGQKMRDLRKSLITGNPPEECRRCCMLDRFSRGKMTRIWRAEFSPLRQMF